MQAPHPPLRDYYGDESARSGWVERLFDGTSVDYDRIERAMALGSGSRYRGRALRRGGLKSGMRVLDIGVGTGPHGARSCPAGRGSGLGGGDRPQRGDDARAKVPAGLQLLIGSADAIPVAPATADFLSMGYALRHVGDLSAAFREFSRVLAPGGRLCLLEITSPRGRVPRALLRGYMRGVVPFVARCMTKNRDLPTLMRYYWDTHRGLRLAGGDHGGDS